MTTKRAARFFIIWNPSHPSPPTRKFENEIDALEVASDMARRFKEVFYVCEATTVYADDLPGIKLKAVAQ